jgi:hypothetical protein
VALLFNILHDLPFKEETNVYIIIIIVELAFTGVYLKNEIIVFVTSVA